MLTWFAKNLRNVYRVLNTHDSPRQMAAGVAFGLWLGLVPKGNLLAIVLAAIFFSLRLNLSLGLITAAVISFFAGLVDPIAHRVGLWLLESPTLRPLWVSLINVPLVPWTRFNNSVVLGNLLLGLLLFYPAYRAVLPACVRWRATLDRRLAARSGNAQGSEKPTRTSVGDGRPSPAARLFRLARLKHLMHETESIAGRRAA